MNEIIRNLTFQPVQAFGTALTQIFPGYHVRYPLLLKNVEDVDHNKHCPGQGIEIGKYGEILALDNLRFGLSAQPFLNLEKGQTWVEIILPDRDETMKIEFLYVKNLEGLHNSPMPLTRRAYDFDYHKLNDEVFVHILSKFLKNKFSCSLESTQWIEENMLPLL